ncbi:translation initiation factor [Leptolyngbya sp. FACHB-36]|uniref:translation initiation factor n=1 Tax=Leptolyngbya sp. FACHB-36 TaxID=2692808 RepID=UPI00168019B8|nr:translation initiation factor [Leptolyngbya sp. FACHB-36]MBD2020570.1 translation initiation factor [Leptolyngbya sp. FACHB-36]
MSSSNSSKSGKDRAVYSEFGNATNSEALKRSVPDLPANQQQVRVETSRSGRKGKTVTIVRGFQASPETLADLLKKLKTLCGAGGTAKENELEIQGDHKQKIVEFLVKAGYKAKGSGG